MRWLLGCSLLQAVVSFWIPSLPEKLEAHALPVGAPPRPVIPAQFSSSVQHKTMTTFFPGAMYYDKDGKRYNISSVEPPVVGNWTVRMQQLALNTSFFLIVNDRCQLVPGGQFGDLFSWVLYAKYMGNETLGPEFDNRTVDVWQYIVPNQTSLVLKNQQNAPVLLNITNLADSTYSMVVYFETDFKPGMPDPSVFVPPADCLTPDPLCPGGEVTEMDSFIFHPKNEFDLNNENVADLMGDTTFICADAISNHTSVDQYEWVSRYYLQVWSGWGQYAECNRPTPNATGECIGSETFAVGREASFAAKEKCGQCTDNSDTGSWFSLPTGGMCNSTTQPLGPDASKGQCTWRVIQKVKTIDGKCLLTTNGLFDMCKKEGYPFTQSQKILQQSFDSSDPSQGGCPPIA